MTPAQRLPSHAATVYDAGTRFRPTGGSVCAEFPDKSHGRPGAGSEENTQARTSVSAHDD